MKADLTVNDWDFCGGQGTRKVKRETWDEANRKRDVLEVMFGRNQPVLGGNVARFDGARSVSSTSLLTSKSHPG